MLKISSINRGFISPIVIATALVFGGKTEKSKAQEPGVQIPPMRTPVVKPLEVVEPSETVEPIEAIQQDDKDPNDIARERRRAYKIAQVQIDSKKYYQAISTIQDQLLDKENTLLSIQEEALDKENKIVYVQKWHMTYSLANKLLDQIPEEHIHAFFKEDGIIGGKARGALTKVVADGNLNGLQKIWDQFSRTPAGKEAAFLTIENWLDTGQIEKLYSFFTDELKSIDETKSAYILTDRNFAPMIHFKAARFFFMIGDAKNLEKAAALIDKKHLNNTIAIGGKEYLIKDVLAEFKKHKSEDKEWVAYLKAFKQVEDRKRENIGKEYGDSPLLPVVTLDIGNENIVSSTMLPDRKTFISLTTSALHVFQPQGTEYKELDKVSFSNSESYYRYPRPEPLVFSGGRTIVTLLADNELHLLNFENGKLKKIDAKFVPGIDFFTSIPDGDKQIFIAGNYSGRLILFEVEENKLREKQILHLHGSISMPTLLSDEKTIVITKEGRISLKIRPMENPNKSNTIFGAILNSIPYPQRVEKDKIFAYKYDSGRLVKVVETDKFKIRRVKPKAFPNEKDFAAVSQGRLSVLRFEDNDIREIASGYAANFSLEDLIDISPDGKIIAVSSHYGSMLSVYQFADDKLEQLGIFEAPKYDVNQNSTTSYKPIILPPNIIVMPVTDGYLYTVQITDGGLKEMGKVPFLGNFKHFSLITPIKEIENEMNDYQSWSLVVANKVFDYANLKRPKKSVDYSLPLPR